MRIENVSRVLVLPFPITQKTSSTFASSTFQSWIIILYSRFHVEENRIFHLFLKKDSLFSISKSSSLNFFLENFNISENDIIIVGTVKELWYEQYEPLCSYMQVSFILLYEILYYYKI